MPPVVFVHGCRTSANIWAEQTAVLARAGHRSHALDLPGHGTRRGETFTLPGALDAVDAAVDACETPPLLVGLSLGGYVSLAYAARYRKVAGLMVSGCSTAVDGRLAGLWGTVSGRIARLFAPHGTWHVVEEMLTALRPHSALDELRRVTVPIWIVNGRRDLYRLGERTALTAQPAARLVIVPRAGHDVPLDAPTPYSRILFDALTALADGALRPRMSPSSP